LLPNELHAEKRSRGESEGRERESLLAKASERREFCLEKAGA